MKSLLFEGFKSYYKKLEEGIDTLKEDYDDDLPRYDEDKSILFSLLGNKLYHCTYKHNVDSILKRGLKNFWFTDSDDFDDLEDMIASNNDYKIKDDFVIFEIPKSRLNIDKVDFSDATYDGDYWNSTGYYKGTIKVTKDDIIKGTLQEDNESSNEYDSEGNQLTKAQEEYFKDSKIRDNNGNLLVCYHNTPYDFKSFDKTKIGSGDGGASFGKGFYFSIGDDVSSNYDGDYTLQCYLNITNPFNYYNCHIEDVKNLLDNSNYAYDKEVLDDIDDGYLEDADLIDNILDDILIENNPYEVFSEMVKNAGYDGIIAGEEVIAFEPNQIKRISNTNPTSKDGMNEEI